MPAKQALTGPAKSEARRNALCSSSSPTKYAFVPSAMMMEKFRLEGKVFYFRAIILTIAVIMLLTIDDRTYAVRCVKPDQFKSAKRL